MNSIAWKLREHSDIVKAGFKHSLIRDALSSENRATSYIKWKESRCNLTLDAVRQLGCNISEDTPKTAFSEVFFEGVYNIREFTPFRGDVVIDVGASYGDTAIWWSKVFGARVIGFEPLDDVYRIFQKNIELNNADVTAYNIALGNGTNISGSTKGKMLSLDTSPGSMNFPTQRLDDFSFQRVDLLKIDVEGFECEVLAGATNTINKFQPKIIVEMHSKELTKKCNKLLADLGYHIKVVGRKMKLKNSWMDLVQNVFYMPPMN